MFAELCAGETSSAAYAKTEEEAPVHHRGTESAEKARATAEGQFTSNLKTKAENRPARSSSLFVFEVKQATEAHQQASGQLNETSQGMEAA